MRSSIILEKKDENEIVLRAVMNKVQTGKVKKDGTKYYMYRFIIPYKLAVDFDGSEVQVIIRKVKPKEHQEKQDVVDKVIDEVMESE